MGRDHLKKELAPYFPELCGCVYGQQRLILPRKVMGIVGHQTSSAYDSKTSQVSATEEEPGAKVATANTSLQSNGAELRRVYWGRHRGRVVCTFNSGFINHQTVVLVTASEGDEGNTTQSPQRFVGSADFTVASIAPFDRGVKFVVEIGWNDPISLWTDIVIMDGFPQGFIRA